MKKKIVASILMWLLVLGSFLLLTFLTSSFWGMISCVVWLVLPIITWVLSFVGKKYISVNITIPATIHKNHFVQGKLTVTNKGWIPIGRIYCKICFKNQLTKEVQEETLKVSAPAKSTGQWQFEICSNHCGYLQATISKVYLMDWIGFLPVSCKGEGKGKSAVLPDTFTPTVYLSVSTAPKEDAEAWSEIQKGNDQTEVFALRDYVEGDSLKQIHWKLSSKRQQLIVKEPSMPVEKSLLIFWDKNPGVATATDMDAMAESVASVAQEICSQGILFTVGWTEGKEKVFEDIHSEDELLQTIPRMLKWGADETGVTDWNEDRKEKSLMDFGKIIYIGKAISGSFEEAFNGEVSYIICDRDYSHSVWSVVNFEGDTYLSDLETMQL